MTTTSLLLLLPLKSEPQSECAECARKTENGKRNADPSSSAPTDHSAPRYVASSTVRLDDVVDDEAVDATDVVVVEVVVVVVAVVDVVDCEPTRNGLSSSLIGGLMKSHVCFEYGD